MSVKYRRNLHEIIDLKLPAAELGVAEGYFSADILSWGVKKIYMVDAWMHLKQFGDAGNTQEWHNMNLYDAMERVKKYGNKAVILRGLSAAMADSVTEELGYVNVDCDHSYQGVKADIEAWWPKLAKGGVMSFHDYENPNYGVKQAVTEFANKEGLEIHLLPEDKAEDAGAYLIKC